jgi:DNA-binding IclR family transcriptional regulator
LGDLSQTLERGLRVLEAIDAATAIGVRELARDLGLGASIVQRLVNTLEQRGFIEQVAESRRYQIGYRSIVLGQSSRHDDTQNKVAHVALLALAQRHGLNGYLGVMHGDRAVYVLTVPSRHRVVLRVDAGETMHLHSTALGKVLLAAAGDARARALLGPGPLFAVTAHTITNVDVLIETLPEIRSRGYASVIEENITGIVSLGAPVRNEHGTIVAGMSVAFAKGTTDLDDNAVAKLVIEAAARVSRTVGCPERLLNSWDEQ